MQYRNGKNFLYNSFSIIETPVWKMISCTMVNLLNKVILGTKKQLEGCV